MSWSCGCIHTKCSSDGMFPYRHVQTQPVVNDPPNVKKVSSRDSLPRPWCKQAVSKTIVRRMRSFHEVVNCVTPIFIIIRQPLCPISKLPCLVLSAVISCRSSICQSRLSIANYWLVSLVVFSCHGLQVVARDRGPSVVFEADDMPCPGPFHFSHSVHYIYDFCPLPDPAVGPSIFACDVEHNNY